MFSCETFLFEAKVLESFWFNELPLPKRAGKLLEQCNKLSFFASAAFSDADWQAVNKHIINKIFIGNNWERIMKIDLNIKLYDIFQNHKLR